MMWLSRVACVLAIGFAVTFAAYMTLLVAGRIPVGLIP